MTVQAELNTGASKLEYILCVEGIGYPSDPSDTSETFDGDVFVTCDINGDLASKLGCTIHGGLEVPSTIEDSLDRESMIFDPGGASFGVIDIDSVLAASWANVGLTAYAVTTASLKWSETTVRLSHINPSLYAPDEGDIAWIAGTEAIKLGSKSLVGGSVYDYTGSTRGYLGTLRGNYNVRSSPTLTEFEWKVGTYALKNNPRWNGRKAILYAHVPGEARDNLIRLFTGAVRDVSTEDNSMLQWSISCVSDVCPAANRTIRAPKGLKVVLVYGVTNQRFDENGALDNHVGIYVGGATAPPLNVNIDPRFVTETTPQMIVLDKADTGTSYDRFGILYGYPYRSAVDSGGRVDAYNTVVADKTTPLAPIVDGTIVNDNYLYEGVMRIGSQDVYVARKMIDTVTGGGVEYPYTVLLAYAINPHYGSGTYTPIQYGALAVPTLDKTPLRETTGQWLRASRWLVQNRVTNHPINVALAMLTSMPFDFDYITETAGGASTPVTGSSGTANGQYDGYTLFSVSDNSNALVSDMIDTHTTASVSLRIGYPSNVSIGDVFQVRNTKWDTLPTYAAMGVHHDDIDITSFTRFYGDEVFGGDEFDYFVMHDGTDMWEMLIEGLCRPYNLFLFRRRTTGKLTLKRYLSNRYSESESYHELTDDDVIGIDGLELMPHMPSQKYYVYEKSDTTYDIATAVKLHNGPLEFDTVRHAAVSLEEHSLTEINVPESRYLVPQGEPTEEFEFYLPFNSPGKTNGAIANLAGNVLMATRNLPKTRITLNQKWIPDVEVGDLLKVTLTDLQPYDPTLGSTGWTDVYCRVNSTSIDLEAPGISVMVDVMGSSSNKDAVQFKAVAPACTVTGKGTHGLTHYFAVNENDFKSDEPHDGIASDQKDWDGFAVGDLIELRNENGVVQESEEIESFGANEASTTAGASTYTVNVVGSIVSTINSGDYITFATYASGTATANMKKYAFLADSNGTIDSDDGHVYG